MRNTTNYDKYSQLLLEDYLRENKLEAEDNATVYSNSTMIEQEGNNETELGSKKENSKTPVIQEELLLERILSKANLNLAYKRVKANKGSHGVDGMRIEDLFAYLKANKDILLASLFMGKYKPQPVRRVEIPKPDGGVRLLGIPTVVDRVIQQAIAQILIPIYEKKFSKHSYGFRPKRSAHQAMQESLRIINSGYTWVVDIDLAKFFDTVNHDKLIRLISQDIKDGRVISLIRKYLVSGVMTGGEFMKTEMGTPQGGNLSPLLSNIMLHELDCELEKRGLQFCRYADDCNIYVKSEKSANRVMKSITRFIEIDLKLKVNQDKSSVDRPWNLKFLGFTVCYSKPKDKYVLLTHKKSIKKFKAKLKALTSRSSGISMKTRLEKIAQAIRGWVAYFGISSLSSIARELDGWLRRRIRMCMWKSWKRISNQYANLVRLSANRDKAWMFTNWRKGYWEKSNNPMLHDTLTNKYLTNMGLVSILTTYSGKR